MGIGRCKETGLEGSVSGQQRSRSALGTRKDLRMWEIETDHLGCLEVEAGCLGAETGYLEVEAETGCLEVEAGYLVADYQKLPPLLAKQTE